MAVLKYKDENGNWHPLPIVGVDSDMKADQTYNPESKNAQSGVAVAEAVRDKPTIHFGTKVSIPDPSVGMGSVEQWNSIPPYKKGDIYINTAEKRAYICTDIVVKEASGSVLAKYYVTITWKGLTNPVAYKYDPESSELQTGRTVAEAINKIIGDIGDEQTVAEMFSNIAEVLENEYATKEAVNEFLVNIIKVFGVLSYENPYFADSILYANSEGNAITADDIKIGDLRNAINDIADFKETAVSKEYIDGLVGDINEALETALNGGM